MREAKEGARKREKQGGLTLIISSTIMTDVLDTLW